MEFMSAEHNNIIIVIQKLINLHNML